MDPAQRLNGLHGHQVSHRSSSVPDKFSLVENILAQAQNLSLGSVLRNSKQATSKQQARKPSAGKRWHIGGKAMSSKEIREMFRDLGRGKSPHWCMQRRHRPLVVPVRWQPGPTIKIAAKQAA
jgi:hypothetical protein